MSLPGTVIAVARDGWSDDDARSGVPAASSREVERATATGR
ncbi:hypothetical protein [Saccharothrix xinjiangensis]|uniref:Uncharacterized protein n=1 Tax=Saccharothrix xinjiangensis TaxID=204798 RepID=A0ABV9YAR0_9PSEU